MTLPHPVTVAQAVADQTLPAPLLSTGVAGLRLTGVTRIDISQDSAWAYRHSNVTYMYQTPGGVPFTVASRPAGVKGRRGGGGDAAKEHDADSDRRGGTTTTITTGVVSLTLDGKPVPASYEDIVDGSRTNQDLSYTEPSTGLVVDIFSGLDHDSFLAAVATWSTATRSPRW